MSQNLSRFKFGTLAFVGAVAFVAANLVGTEDQEGVVAQFVDEDDSSNRTRAAAPPPPVAMQSEIAPPREEYQPSEFYADDELVEMAEGFDPTPDGLDENNFQEDNAATPRVQAQVPRSAANDSMVAEPEEGDIVMIDGRAGPFF
ncbi:hypothetical protein GRI43_12000 [Altererythrobacter luteolus]|uniref:Uncharacterized protein n=1 Tax=Pontixanthobacter luteolus TaxID=295089 RepID=A0A6I4V1D9_9SPHN|nr:hypothetical protein [Pontixanthobacter luteolus]MXP48109.1 hypothetical protein [Pontixanthobacter luteolus]